MADVIPPGGPRGGKKRKKKDEEEEDDGDDEPEPPTFNTVETLLSFIPYTKQNKIAAAATEMLDNLKRIQKEKSKAYDLMTMARIGQHEEALKTLLGETTDKVDYFVALRKKMEDDGKPIRTEVRKDTVLSLERGKGKNRLKRATDVERDLSELIRKKKVAARNKSTAAGDDAQQQLLLPPPQVVQKCGWYGYDQNGIALRCRNPCIVRKKKDGGSGSQSPDRHSYGGGDPADRFQYCPYHSPYCLARKAHPSGRAPIQQPNAAGLCRRCFATRYPGLAHFLRPTCPHRVLRPVSTHAPTTALPLPFVQTRPCPSSSPTPSPAWAWRRPCCTPSRCRRTSSTA